MADNRTRLGDIPIESTEDFANRMRSQYSVSDAEMADIREREQRVADITAMRAGDYVHPEYGEISTGQGRTATYISGLGRGLARGTGAVAKGLAGAGLGILEAGAEAVGAEEFAQEVRDYDVRKHPFYRAGQTIEEAGKVADINPAYADELGYKVSETVGAMAPAIGATVINPIAGGVTIAGQLAGEGVEDVLASPGAEAGDVGTTALLSTLQTPLEFLPIGRALSRLSPSVVGDLSKYGVKEGLKETGKKAALGAVEEAGTESLQTIISNKVASDVVGYDEDRAALQGIQDSMEVGGATGFLVNALAAGFGAKVKMRAGKIQKGVQDAQALEAERQDAIGPEQPIVQDLQGGRIPTEEEYYAGKTPPPSGGQLTTDTPTIDPRTGRPTPPVVQPRGPEGTALPDEFIPAHPLERFSTEEIQARDEQIMSDYANYEADSNALSTAYYEQKDIPPPELKNLLTQERMRLTVDETGTPKEMSDGELADYRSLAIPNYKALTETSWYVANELKAEEAVRKFMNNIEAGVKPNRGMSKKQSDVLDNIFNYNKYMDEAIIANRDSGGVIDTEKAAEELVAKITPTEVEGAEAPMSLEEAEDLIEKVIASPKYERLVTQEEEQVAFEQDQEAALNEVATQRVAFERSIQEERAAVEAALPQTMSEQAVERKKKTAPRKINEIDRYEQLSNKYKDYQEGLVDMSEMEQKIYRKLDKKYGLPKTPEEVLYTGHPEEDVNIKEALDIVRNEFLGTDPKDDTDFMLDEPTAEYEGEALANMEEYQKDSVIQGPVFHGTHHAGFDVVDPNAGELGFHVGTHLAALERVLSMASSRVSRGEVVDIETALNSARIMPLTTNIKKPFPMEDITDFGEPDTLEEEIMRQWEQNPDLLSPSYNDAIDEIMGKFALADEKLQAKIADAVNKDDMTLYDKLDEQENQLKRKTVAEIRESLIKEGYDSVVYENGNEDAGSLSYIVFDPTQVKHMGNNIGKFDPSNPNMNRSIGKPNFKQGMPEAQRRTAKRMIEKLQAQLDSAGIKVSMVDKWQNIPGWLNGSINRMIQDGDMTGPYRIKGAVKGNEVALMMDNITDIKEFQKVIYHEIIGHYSMEAMFGDKFTNLLDKIAVSPKNKNALEEVASRYKLDLETEEGRRTAAKEYIASIAETNKNPSLLKRVVAWVKHQLRKLGINIEIASDDIAAYVSKAASEFSNQKLNVKEATDADINFAIERTAPDEDTRVEMSKILSALQNSEVTQPAEAMRTWMGDKANTVMNYIMDKGGSNLTLLKKLPNQPAYKAVRNALQGHLHYFDKTNTFIRETLAGESEANQDIVIDFLTEETVGIDTVPEHLQEAALLARTTIDKLGAELVNAGILKKDVYEANKGTYLPNMYLYFMTGNHKVLNAGGSIKKSVQNYLKKRTLDKNNPNDKKVMDLLGHVKDPGFVASNAIMNMGRDISIHNFFSALKEYSGYQASVKGESNPWVYPTDLVEYKGKKMSIWAMEENVTALQKTLDLGGNPEIIGAEIEAMQDILNEAYATSDTIENLDHDLYEQLPKDRKRYGDLAGLSVRKEIANDMAGNIAKYTENPSLAERLLGETAVTRFHKAWKGLKTVDNPAGHVRNFIGNFVLFDISTQSNSFKVAHTLFDEMQKQVEAFKTGKRNTSIYRDIAERGGIPMSTFTATETLEANRDWIVEAEKAIAESKKEFSKDNLGRYGKAYAMSLMLKYHEVLSHAYQGSETLFKVAKIRDYIETWESKAGRKYSTLKGDEKTLLEQEALDAANHAILDYSMIPNSLRWLRNAPIGAPFLTFSYLATARSAEAMMKHPVKMMQYQMVPWAMSQLAMTSLGMDDDDMAKWEASLPEYMESGMYVPLPWKNENGEVYNMNIGYYAPWEPVTRLGYHDIIKQTYTPGGDVELSKALTNAGILGGPIPQIITALTTGIDSFTGKPIKDPYGSDSDNRANVLAYVYNMMTPPIISTTGAAGHAWKHYVNEEINPKTGHYKGDAATVLPRAVGVNIYRTDLPTSRQTRIKYLRSDIDKQKAYNRKQHTDAIRQGISPEERASMLKEHSRMIKDKQEVLRSYIRKSSGEE